ncbi:MAG: type II toxin-antitoxin system VapC family toxin [Alphaproteobacteria bacterium]
MSFVLDSSVCLTWCFEDERTDATQELLDRTTYFGADAPSHWPLEVLNGLAMGERRRRIDAAKRQQLSGFLRNLPVVVDSETIAQAWEVTSKLASAYRLTVYDAAYLELALRRGLPLATLDRELRAAGDAMGVTLLGV